jgi:hypothetical protein
MRFKVQRTLLENPTLKPYRNGVAGPNAVQRGEEDYWYVEIPDLEALIEFSQVHGELVIGSDGFDHYLEIYDTRREGGPDNPRDERIRN